MKTTTISMFILIVVAVILTACATALPEGGPVVDVETGATMGAELVGTAKAALTATATTQPPTKIVGVLEADEKYRAAMLGFFRIDAPSVTAIGAPDCGALTQMVDTELAKGNAIAFAMVVHNDIMGNGVACLETELIRKYPTAYYVVYGYSQLDPAHRADLEKIGTRFFSKDFASSDVPAYKELVGNGDYLLVHSQTFFSCGDL